MESSIPLSPEQIKRFWDLIAINSPDECWPWQGYIDPTEQQKANILELISAGIPKVEVARRIGISRDRVYRVLAANRRGELREESISFGRGKPCG